jgi:PAS domain S-box-containing protein
MFDQESGILLEVNRMARQLLGYTPSETILLSFKTLFSREQRRRLLRTISQARKTGHAEAPAVKIRRKDGALFVGEVTFKSGHIDNKEIIYGTFRDTTRVTNLQIELHRNNRHLTLLNQISHRVAEGHDLPQTLEIILDEVVGSFSISGGGIFLTEHRGTEMKLALHRNIPDNVVEELGRIQPGMGLAGKVVETGRPRMSTNLQNDHRRISSAVFADNWRAFLAVPFIAEEETLGVLFVFDRGQRVFNREDVRLIQAIGRQLGPILKNAELFDELKWQHRLNFASMRELERSRTALRSHLELLEQNHRALQSLNQMKSTFLSLASHELRTPLTTIMSGAEFLQDAAGDHLGASERRAMDVIIRGSERLNHIVDNLLEAARLEAKVLYMEREAFNPLLIIREIVEEYHSDCANRGLHLELTEFPEHSVVRGDVHHLKRAFSRLLENAVKFTPEGGWIRVSGREASAENIASRADTLKPFSENFFSSRLKDKYLEVAVCDSGIGLARDDQLKIFDKFHEVGEISSHSSSREGFGGKGVGLGLTLAKGILETHDGLIWVESKGIDQGSCFSAILPMSSPDEGKHVLG